MKTKILTAVAILCLACGSADASLRLSQANAARVPNLRMRPILRKDGTIDNNRGAPARIWGIDFFGKRMVTTPAHTGRRWFRFSLRTLFVVVTVGCVCLSHVAWNRHVIAERRQVINWIESKGGWVMRESDREKQKDFAPGKRPISWLRSKMGDEVYMWIDLPENCSLEDDRTIKGLFPDAHFFPRPMQWKSINNNSNTLSTQYLNPVPITPAR